jgi:hypothetical protein
MLSIPFSFLSRGTKLNQWLSGHITVILIHPYTRKGTLRCLRYNTTYSLGYALESVTLLILGLNKANLVTYSPFENIKQIS